jgi:2-iminobutanoate/2-iminopropanoate deaminase
MRTIAAAFACLLAIGATGQTREVIFTAGAPKPIGPYSQAVKVNGRLYVSGQIALKPDGTLDTSSIRNECRQVMENLSAIVKSAGFEVGRIVKTTIYTTDLKQFSAINEVYGSYFTSDPPARETVEVKSLPKGAHIEISVIAEK